MFKTILVPLDGSSRAEAALPFAARIARQTGGKLVLVRVVSFFSEYWPAIATTYPSMNEAVIESELAEATTYLERVALSPKLVDLSITIAVQYGPAAPTILAVASSHKSDLIVLCSHGETGMVHWMMGSVAEKIARHADMPVLVLRDGYTHLDGNTSTDLAQPLHMLVPLDGSISAQAALQPGVALLMALAAPRQKIVLHLARIVKPPRVVHAQSTTFLPDDSELPQIKAALNQTAWLLQKDSLIPNMAEHHVSVGSSVVVDVDVASALLHMAGQREETENEDEYGKCALIAMSTHGRSGFRRWMMGSVTERVLSAAKCPILIVHPPEQAEEREATGEKLASYSVSR